MPLLSHPIVIIESPYAGHVSRNLSYARAAMHDSIMRAEVPLASHLLYTQAGILDDDDHEQRALGIRLGYELWRFADIIAFYVDLGWSPGMEAALDRAFASNQPLRVEQRKLPDWAEGRTINGSSQMNIRDE